MYFPVGRYTTTHITYLLYVPNIHNDECYNTNKNGSQVSIIDQITKMISEYSGYNEDNYLVPVPCTSTYSYSTLLNAYKIEDRYYTKYNITIIDGFSLSSCRILYTRSRRINVQLPIAQSASKVDRITFTFTFTTFEEPDAIAKIVHR